MEVKGYVTLPAAEPLQHLLFPQFGQFRVQDAMVGTVGVLGEIIKNAVDGGVGVDIVDQAGKIGFGKHRFPLEVFFEQAARAALLGIDGFGIRQEKTPELFTDDLVGFCQAPAAGDHSSFFFGKRIGDHCPHQQVEMIGKQAVGVQLQVAGQVVVEFLQKVAVVFGPVKEILPVVSPVVDVVERMRNEGRKMLVVAQKHRTIIITKMKVFAKVPENRQPQTYSISPRYGIGLGLTVRDIAYLSG
jgi:hypothetical protein